MRITSAPTAWGCQHRARNARLNASFATFERLAGRSCRVAVRRPRRGILRVADEKDLGIRMFANVGNRADVGAHDLLEYWEHEDEIELILSTSEVLRRPERFKAAAGAPPRQENIVAVKSGRSAAGATRPGLPDGVSPGSDITDRHLPDPVRRAPRPACIARMFDFASALLHQPRPAGGGIAVVTNAGGPRILAADALDSLVELPELQARTVARCARPTSRRRPASKTPSTSSPRPTR
ncbi:MAG: hypothetical protein R3F30_06045 [Planctomycetota bacterium]